ncbi:MAG: hypothetical protein JSS63_15060 [Bacteroidetes bacterium]|nr:hypothetical protein [Bacteroidota bacterium]
MNKRFYKIIVLLFLSACFTKADAQLLNFGDFYSLESFVIKHSLLREYYIAEASTFKNNKIKKVKAIAGDERTIFLMILNEEGMPVEIKKQIRENLEVEKYLIDYVSANEPSKISYYLNSEFQYNIELFYKNGKLLNVKCDWPELKENEIVISYDENNDKIEKLTLLLDGQRKSNTKSVSNKGATVFTDNRDSIKIIFQAIDKFIMMSEPRQNSEILTFSNDRLTARILLKTSSLANVDKSILKNLKVEDGKDKLSSFIEFMQATNASSEIYDYNASGIMNNFLINTGSDDVINCNLEFEYYTD